MARKKKHPEHENLERWLVSYADFMTLLFATFTALYALAQTDAAKLKDVSTAIREGFEQQSIISGIKSIIQGQSPPNHNPDPISSDKGAGSGVIGKFDSMTYQPGEVKSLEHLVDDLTSDLKEVNKGMQTAKKALSEGQNEGGQTAEGQSAGGNEAQEENATPVRPIEAAVQQRGVRISFDSRLLFAPGSATLQMGGRKFLDVVANRLKKFDSRRIHVEGHTDDQPISTLIFPSNWELSGARASSVVRYFIGSHHFNPSSMVAVGYGSTQPLGSNATQEGRAKNRRVDIILYNEKSSMLLNPRVQFLQEKPLNTLSSTTNAAKEILPNLPTPPKDGPVRVIFKDKDGTEKVLIPKTKELVPIDKFEAEQKAAASESASSSVPARPARLKPSAPKSTHKPTQSHGTSHTTSMPKSAPLTPPVPGHAADSASH